MTENNEDLVIPKNESWKMFDAIAPRYDFVNRLLSFGQDMGWRKKLMDYKGHRTHMVLDLATGTADVLLTLVKEDENVKKAFGLDRADKMLDIGREKIARAGLEEKIVLKRGDAQRIPFPNNSFDLVTIAFGIRNMNNPSRVLREIHRVLKPRGRVLILEFSQPRNPLLRWGHGVYLRYVLPLLGGLFSGNFKAYRYLNQTIQAFPYGNKFCELMIKARLRRVHSYPLMGGVASIYQGEKFFQRRPHQRFERTSQKVGASS